jgi:MPBQ/MSBQ methyltransferase
MQTIDPHAVGSHYSQGQLAARLTEALRRAGKNPDAPTTADLAGVDEFHVRGREATLELANLARLRRGSRVLDVGGGIGGPARTLASEFGCTVEVLDLTEEFVVVGESLTEQTGLSDRVTFRLGSALAMPYPDRSFEVVWSQHSSMNIAAKDILYREMSRVLQPRGTLVIFEIMAGPVQPLHFPVPWARAPEISSLVLPDHVRELIESFGLRQVLWNDATSVSREWVAARLSASGPPMPLGLHVILGADLKPMMDNVLRNFDERRMVVIQGVFTRP